MKIRKLALLVAGACMWSAPGWATYVETAATATQNGQGIPGATVKVTINQAPKRAVTQSTPASQPQRPKQVVQQTTAKTDAYGRFTFKYDDGSVDPSEATVDLVFLARDGHVLGTRAGIPLSAFGLFGLPVEVPMPQSPSFTMAWAPNATSAVRQYFDGFYFGGQGSGSLNDQAIRETIAGTRIVSNRLYDTKNMGSFGVVAGWDFPAGSWPVTFGPFGSANYVGQSNYRYFGMSSIGLYTNWYAVVGGKLAVQISRYAALYALGGVEFRNYDFNINFALKSSDNRTAVGWTAGAGTEFTQQNWRLGNGQVMGFAQGTYSEFCGEIFRMPLGSSGFDYKTRVGEFRFTGGATWRPNFSSVPPL
jgi:opacity protein-like surface antigen